MPHIATVTAFELEMGDELGEGEVICRIDGFTRQSIERAGEPDWSRVATRDISVLLKPQQIVWRMHPGGPNPRLARAAHSFPPSITLGIHRRL